VPVSFIALEGKEIMMLAVYSLTSSDEVKSEWSHFSLLPHTPSWRKYGKGYFRLLGHGLNFIRVYYYDNYY
jgi:hypothetical protein